jgi:plasmid stabilization system protein ParE
MTMPPLPVNFNARSRREYQSAYRYYSRIDAQLAKRFADTINAALVAIGASPDIRSQPVPNVYKYVVGDFPYLIFYRVLPTQVRVLRFVHKKQQHPYWRQT